MMDRLDCFSSMGLKVLEVWARLFHTLLSAEAPSIGWHLLNTCGTQNMKEVGVLIRGGAGRAQKETPQPLRTGWTQMAAQTACWSLQRSKRLIIPLDHAFSTGAQSARNPRYYKNPRFCQKAAGQPNG